MDQLILIDKPRGWTSFDVVAKIRAAIRQSTGERVKVGHAGTLDPFATGLLLILVGKTTKDQDRYMKQDKEYVATLQLGATSTTGDPEGEITIRDDATAPDSVQVSGALRSLTGKINQTPPAYSAIKINGKRAYELARKGVNPELKSRQVVIKELVVISYEWPFLKIRVRCSSGTYIRTLAEQIGEQLKVGGYLVELHRTRIGEYNVTSALSVEEAVSRINN